MIKTIWVHHSAIINTGNTQFLQINKYHRDKWHFKSSLNYYAGYTYLLDTDNKLKQYRAVGEEQAAQRGYNKNSISLCVAGNFEKEQLTQKTADKLKEILDKLRKKYPNANIRYHKEVSNTLCCGKNLIEWVKQYRKSPHEDTLKRAKRLGEIERQKKITILQSLIKAYQTLIKLLRK